MCSPAVDMGWNVGRWTIELPCSVGTLEGRTPWPSGHDRDGGRLQRAVASPAKPVRSPSASSGATGRRSPSTTAAPTWASRSTGAVGRERPGDVPLAQRPLRPALGRHARPLGRRRAGLPRRDRRRQRRGGRLARARPAQPPPAAAGGGAGAGHQPGHGQGGPRPSSTPACRSRTSCGRAWRSAPATAEAGWGAGLTVLTAMANVLPHLDPADRPLALVDGLAFVSRDTRGRPPRFPLAAAAGRAAARPARRPGTGASSRPGRPTPPSGRWRRPSPPPTTPRSRDSLAGRRRRPWPT